MPRHSDESDYDNQQDNDDDHVVDDNNDKYDDDDDDDADNFGDDDPSLVGRVRLGNNFFDMIIVETIALLIFVTK